MAAHQAPLSLGFSRREYWSGLPFPSPMHACMLSRFSRDRLCATPRTAAHQAPPSTGSSRQEYWSGLPFPSPPRFAISLLFCEYLLHSVLWYFFQRIPYCWTIWPDEGSVCLSVSGVSMFNKGEKYGKREKHHTVLRKGCWYLHWQLDCEQNWEGIKRKKIKVLSGFPQSSTRATCQKIIL